MYLLTLRSVTYCEAKLKSASAESSQGCQVQKSKKAKFGHKPFQTGQILKNENKGQIFFQKLVKITRL